MANRGNTQYILYYMFIKLTLALESVITSWKKHVSLGHLLIHLKTERFLGAYPSEVQGM